MSSVSRRTFLGGAAVGAVAVAAPASAAVPETTPEPVPRPTATFRGPHQPGILTAPATAGLLAAFRCVDADRRALRDTFRTLSAEVEALMGDRSPRPLDRALPPADNSLLEDVADPRVVATVSVGASLFDGRYGLAARRPRELVPMTRLANDRLDPERTHGDLLVIFQGDHPDVCIHAMRRVMRATRSGLVLHWMLEAFNRPDPNPTPGQTFTRNLLGFRDGTANPDATSPRLMDDLVWVGAADRAEPDWAAGGTYQAVRIIRMFVEQWDRTTLSEQESIIGRHKISGAPLGGRRETDVPDFAADPKGTTMPLDAHVRLANPRDGSTAGTLLLRRGFSYSRGFDKAGLLNQGLAFVSYQRRLEHFLRTQARLSGEPLEEYIQPEGGGFFFVLPGVTDPAGWLGHTLLAD